MNLSQEKKQKLLAHLEKTIAELKRLGIWDMTEEQLQGSFLGQLHFGMIPGIQARLAGDHQLPDESNLGAFAIREFDGQTEMDSLTALLCEFDTIYESRE